MSYKCNSLSNIVKVFPKIISDQLTELSSLSRKGMVKKAQQTMSHSEHAHEEDKQIFELFYSFCHHASKCCWWQNAVRTTTCIYQFIYCDLFTIYQGSCWSVYADLCSLLFRLSYVICCTDRLTKWMSLMSFLFFLMTGWLETELPCVDK